MRGTSRLSTPYLSGRAGPHPPPVYSPRHRAEARHIIKERVYDPGHCPQAPCSPSKTVLPSPTQPGPLPDKGRRKGCQTPDHACLYPAPEPHLPRSQGIQLPPQPGSRPDLPAVRASTPRMSFGPLARSQVHPFQRIGGDRSAESTGGGTRIYRTPPLYTELKV